MALKSCPECDGSVSDQAKNCPHCGYPMETSLGGIPGGASPMPSTGGRTVLLIAGGCFGLLCLLIAALAGFKWYVEVQEQRTTATYAQAQQIVKTIQSSRGLGAPPPGTGSSIAPYHSADPFTSTKFGNATVQLTSFNPWPNRANRGMSAFQKKALQYMALETRKASRKGGSPNISFYSQHKTINGKLVLQIAIPDVMKKNCVSCHNNTNLFFRDAQGGKWMTPKWDWMVGDIRGIFDVTIPVD